MSAAHWHLVKSWTGVLNRYLRLYNPLGALTANIVLINMFNSVKHMLPQLFSCISSLSVVDLFTVVGAYRTLIVLPYLCVLVGESALIVCRQLNW